MRTLTIHERFRAEELKREIRCLERAQGDIVARFAAHDQFTVEEQRSTRLAFDENRLLLGKMCQELLRLVCV